MKTLESQIKESKILAALQANFKVSEVKIKETILFRQLT